MRAVALKLAHCWQSWVSRRSAEPMSLWHGIGRQLGNPQGFVGRAIGRMMRVANDRPTRLVVDVLDARPGEMLLDMGFGPGHAVALLANTARCVYGIDRSDTMLRQASRLNRRAIGAGRVCLNTGDFSQLPYPDGFFDGIIASNVLYFWKDHGVVLGEIRRVLKPGGRLCIYVTDAATMQRWRFAGVETHRHFTADQLTEILVGAGFALDSLEVRSVTIAQDVGGIIVTAYDISVV
jgi:SAM-dependent methyltransferase